MNDRSISLRVGSWSELAELAAPIRFQVFVDEQAIDPATEIDDADPISIHCVAMLNDKAVGTARLLPDGHIGRMAVLGQHRRHGIGGVLLERLVKEAFSNGHERVALNAQAYVEKFYSQHGFIREGDVFVLEGIEHVSMWRAQRI